MARGRWSRRFDARARALEIRETPQGAALFAQCIRAMPVHGVDDGRFAGWCCARLSEGWARPRELAARMHQPDQAQRPIVHDASRAPMRRGRARLPATELFGARRLGGAGARRTCLCRLLGMRSDDRCRPRALVDRCALAMLESAHAETRGRGRARLGFYCAVARQCFINEYVYAPAEAEDGSAQRLRAALRTGAGRRTAVPPLWPVAVGAYFPLHALPNAKGCCERPWPQCVSAVSSSRSRNRRRNAGIAAAIPALTDDRRTRCRARCASNTRKTPIRAGSSRRRPAQPLVLDERHAGASSRRADRRLRHRPVHHRIRAASAATRGFSPSI